MLKIGWFSTGRGPGSRNLLKTVMDKKKQGLLDIDISFVFCNWDNEEKPNPKKQQRQLFFDMIDEYNLPLVTISWKKFRPDLWEKDQVAWRNEYGKVIRETIKPYNFDLGILAGYMLWMDDDTCEQYDLINLHPALPNGPKGTWEEVIWTLIKERENEQGITIHMCTQDWDSGDTLTCCGFPIVGEEYDKLWIDFENKLKTHSLKEIIAKEGQDEPLFKKIREEGTKRELPLIISTLDLFAKGEVYIKDKKLFRNEKRLEHPYNLTETVDINCEEIK